MFDWVRALLDPTDIVQSPASTKKQITPPPKFEMPPLETLTELAPSRSRSRRSASPVKSSPKKTSSPRKSRQTRAAKESSVAASAAASASLQSALGTAASIADSESVDGAASTNGDTVHDQLLEESKPKKESKRGRKAAAAAAAAEEKAKASIENKLPDDTPVSLPEAPAAEDTKEMIAQAKQMVEQATKVGPADGEEAPSSASPKASKKRKPEEAADEEDKDGETSAQPTKKAKVLEDKLRRERVRNRALVGVTATLALA
jgi:hypothetical protein